MQVTPLFYPLVLRCLCPVLLFAGAHQALAQAPPAVSETDFLSDMPMVLSVSRLPQRLDETPGAVTILDREMIRLSGARDVADLLRLVPGFQTSNSFETGAPLASYHGGFDAYSARLQVLIDGRSAYSPFFFGSIATGLQSVALSDIERIEVLRGSNSAAYGARAMLGVINIVTRHSADTLGVQVGVAGGEKGLADAQARIGWGQEDASYRLSMDQRGDNGLVGSNGHNQINRVNFRADVRSASNDQFEVRIGALAIDAGKGYAGNVDDALRDRVFNSSYAQLDWRRNLGADQDVALTLAHSEELYQDSFAFSLKALGIADSIPVDTGGRSSSDTLTVQHTFRQGPHWRVVWGGELRREAVTSKPLFNTNAPFINEFARLFGNAEWKVTPNVIVNAGAMFERSSDSGESLAPRLMLNWHAAEGQTLRAGISRGYRPPSTFEKHTDVRYLWNGLLLKRTTLASGNVQPESLIARELGYLAEFPRLGVQLDVRAFHEQLGNFVRGKFYANQPGVRDFVNAESFTIQGLEYQLKWRPWRDAQLIFNQAYININSRDPGTALAAPKLATSITWLQKLPGGLDFSLMHQNTGPMTLQGAGDKEQVGLIRTDVRLGLPLRWGAHRGELALVVQNLGNPYPDFRPIFEFERRAFVSLRLEY